MAFELAAGGAGVALGRTSMIGPLLASGRLVAPFDLAVPVDEGFHLIRPDHANNAHKATVFRDWIINAAQQK
jgi:LysR family transcriptional regulator, glycine cleavage system transcriptional activator